MAIGCIPAHGLYFSIYEYMMKNLGLNEHEHNSSYLYSFVGFTSSLFHDLILTPTETLKQRLQLYRSERFRTTASMVAKGMIKTEGLKAFYRSFGVNYFMNVPFGALIVTINETLKHKYLNPEKASLFSYYITAGLAGLLAAVPTCPLDVIKTRLNIQYCTNRMCEGRSSGNCGILKNHPMGIPGGISSHHNYNLLTHKVYKANGKIGK